VPSWYGLQQSSKNFPDLQGQGTLFSVLNGMLSLDFKVVKTWLADLYCQWE